MFSQIIPHPSSTSDGVRDYANSLAEYLKRAEGISSNIFIPQEHDRSETQSKSLSASDLLILHYVNYGYSKRGCPFWLLDLLRNWKSAHSNGSLLVMFHEVYACGPPWRSSFWLNPIQKIVAGKIFELSTISFTSLNKYAVRLARLKPDRKSDIIVQPVFSTIGEPADVTPWTARDPILVVFGGVGTRHRAYEESWKTLVNACRILDIREIIDIGPPLTEKITRLNEISLKTMGYLELASISPYMTRARAGFLDYPADFLPKSTVFAAYCAHGMLPVVPSSLAVQTEGLECNFHYWGGNLSLDCRKFSEIASNARSWYQAHSIKRHAERILGLTGS